MPNVNDELTGLLKEFNVRAEKELINAKTKDKQTRAVTSGAPVLVELTADKCKKLCEAAGLVYKTGFEKRVLNYTTTNEVVDRYGDIVRGKLMDFKTTYFPDNPVMMFAHDYKSLPIGNTIKIWFDKQLKSIPAYGLFMDNDVDKTGWSDIVFTMARAGFLRACSIGFMPKTYNDPKTQEERDALGLGKWGVEYLISEYLEWSPCGIPANPQALNNYISENKKDISFRFFNKEFVDRIATVKLFEDENTLDMFSDLCVGDTCLKISIPEVKDVETEANPDGGGTWKYCVCKKCKYYKTHTAGKPCGKCPKCGEQMSGSNTKPKKDMEDETESYLIEYVREGNVCTEEVDAESFDDAESKATEEYGETANVVGKLINGVPFNKDEKEIKIFCCEFMLSGYKCCSSIRATSWREAQTIADDSELTDELVVGVLDEDLILDKEGNEVREARGVVNQDIPLFSALEGEEKFEEHFNVTDLEDIDEVIKPYQNEHSCRLSSPTKYEKFKRGTRKHNGKIYSVIFGKLKGKNKWEQQAFRYAKKNWKSDDAKRHCKDNKGIKFEPASEKVTASGQPSGGNVQPSVSINLNSNELTNAIKEFTKAVKTFGDIVDKSKPDAQQAAASVDDNEDYTSDSDIQLDKLETDINI